MSRSVPTLAGRPDFSVTVHDADGRTVVAVRGERDMVTSPELADVVEEQLARGPVRLDLTDVEFLDSSAVRVLDRLLRHAGKAGTELTFRAGLRKNVEQVLAMTGLLDVLTFEAR